MVFFLYPIEFPIWCSEHLYILSVNIVEHWFVLLYLFFVFRVEERKSNLFDVLLMSCPSVPYRHAIILPFRLAVRLPNKYTNPPSDMPPTTP